VQVNQTRSLYAGPGVYPGPNFYQNMSTLCYFIQKSTTIVYQYRYFVYFHKALKHWNACCLTVTVVVFIIVHVIIVIKFYQQLIVFVLFLWYVINRLTNLPWLVCWTRLVTRAWLLSVQLHQTAGLYAGPSIYKGPGLYPKFYGI